MQVHEAEINEHGEKEVLPTVYRFEFEQELSKNVHDLINKIRENRWFQQGVPEVSQTSFLRILNQS